MRTTVDAWTRIQRARPVSCPRRWIVAAACLWVMHLGVARGELPAYVSPEQLRDDASLRAVQFVDPDRGWAVGDRGVILHTDSGGDAWSYQHSGTSDGLRDIAAVDARHAIVVGGHIEPETQISRGVVLITDDGGATWQRVDTDLPRLCHVRADRHGNAIAVGDFSGLHLTSAFTSRDGGRSWQPVVDTSLGPLRDSAGTPGGPLSYLDHRGLLFHQRRGGAAPVTVYGDRRLRCVAGDGALRAAVGDANHVLVSRDAGGSWQEMSLNHPAGADPASERPAPQTLLAACEAAGMLWTTGVPGNTIWRISPDGGAHACPTPSDAPLHALCFLDGQRGWAVGAFGTILATRDGGRTWRFQRAASRRAALLIVAEDAISLPWPVLASESLEMGRRTAVVVRAQAAAPADPLAVPPTVAIAEAASAMGGGEVLGWAAAPTEGDAGHALEEAAIAQQALGAYRPTVLLISGSLPTAVRQTWIQAAMQQHTGRVLETSRSSASELTLHASAVLPRVGAITGDLWRDAVAIACPGAPTPDKLLLRRAYDSIMSMQSGRVDGLFAGLPAGDVASMRELAAPASRRHLQILAARSNEHAMIDRMLADGDTRGSYAARLQLMVDQTPADNRQRLLRSILIRCRATQSAQQYRQTLAVASTRLGGTPLGRLAALRLAAIEHSGEWARMHLNLGDRAALAGGPETAAAPVRLSPFETAPVPQQEVQMAASEHAMPFVRVVPQHVNLTPAGATDAHSAAPAIDLAWDFDPRVLIIQSAVQRTASGDSHSPGAESRTASGGEAARGTEAASAAASHLQRLRSAPAAQDWLRLSGIDPAAEPTVAAPRASQRPLLDGRLDEPFWQDATAWTTAAGFQVRLAYDSGYLYWSATGPLADPATQTGPDGRRQRDADLAGDQRVVLRLDVDGDLTTAYALEVNAQGQTRDTCDGFLQWQPMWFVATDPQQRRWTVEAAVRRSDLQPLPLIAGSRWNVRFDVYAPHQPQPLDVLPRADRWQVVSFQ